MSPKARRLGVLRSDSPLVGLRRRRLGFAEVLAQSVAAVAPSAAAVTIPGIVIALAGDLAIWTFLAASVVVVLVAYCLTQFARRMASASGLYSYTAKSIGAAGSFTTGWSLMIGYAGAAMASALGAGVYLASIVGLPGLSDEDGLLALVATVLVVAVVAALLMVRGIQVSARVSLVLEVLSVGLMLAVLLTLLLSEPVRAGPAPALRNDPTFDAAALAVLLAVTAFVGFESSGTLGAESRNPFTVVPRALLWTPLALTALYAVAVTVQTTLFLDQPLSLLEGGAPVAELARLHGNGLLPLLFDIGIFSSWFACLMGSSNALVRILFSMGREGVWPAWLGRTHDRFGTPALAIAVTLPVIAVAPLFVVGAEPSLSKAFVDLLTLSGYGYLVSYGLLCLAAPVFLRRIGELTPLPVAVGAAGFVAITFLVVWTIRSYGFAHGGFAVVYLALMAAGWLRLGYLRWRRPDILAEVGVYDEPVAGDLLPVQERTDQP